MMSMVTRTSTLPPLARIADPSLAGSFWT